MSDSTRFRPAVIALTSLAAAYGIYTIYTAQRSPQIRLHRRNAVHRPRRSEAVEPDNTEATAADDYNICMDYPRVDGRTGGIIWPLGRLYIRRAFAPTDATQPGSQSVQSRRDASLNPVGEVVIGRDGIPSVQDLQLGYGVLGESIRNGLVFSGIRAILASCANPLTERHRSMLESGYDLGDLVNALNAPDQGTEQWMQCLASHIPRISAYLGGVESSVMEVGFDMFFESVGLDLTHGFTNYAASDATLEFRIGETDVNELPDWAAQNPSQDLKGLLFHIAEDNAKRSSYEHRGISCEECGEMPIRNVRYHCLQCPDFDLCSTCECSTQHPKTHILAKIKIPLSVISQPTRQQPVWYPGDPRKKHRTLTLFVKKALAMKHHFEEAQIDALYDQFTTIANVVYEQDPCGIKTAIDRQAFDAALTSERWTDRHAPNILYDRMFAFYAITIPNLIGFEDFLNGMAYLRGPRRYKPLLRALKGFDVDNDGYLSRQDFLRILREKYVLQKRLVTDSVKSKDAEQNHSYYAVDTLKSSLPISSIFQEDMPPGEVRPRHGKQMDVLGDMQPFDGTKTTLDDDDDWVSSSGRNLASTDQTPLSRLREHLSRFEEMLYGADGSDAVRTIILPSSVHEDAAPEVDLDDGDLRTLGLLQSMGTNHVHDIKGQDVVWLATEDSFNELLDPLFKERERLDRDVSETHWERQKWRAAIGDWVRRKQAFEESLRSTADVDPLMATANSSYSVLAPISINPSDLVPTDPASLERLEAEISQKPLEDLLQAAGYSTVDHSPTRPTRPGSPLKQVQNADDLPEPGSLQENRTSDDDPTLPQNIPNIVPDVNTTKPDEAGNGSINPKSAIGPPPSDERLGQLHAFDKAEERVHTRGGPGRVGFEEVIAAVRDDRTGRLKGIVISWLEWASF